MLYRIELENFYCFRDKQEVDLRVRGGVPDMPERFKPIYKGSDERAPVAVAVFGANASGKSTLLKALAFVQHFILHSANLRGFALQPFNSQAAANSPIRIAVEAGAQLSFEEPHNPDAPFGAVRYEVVFNVSDGVITEVAEENLSQKPHGAMRFKSVFSRTGNVVKGSDEFPLKDLKGTHRALPAYASAVAFFNYLSLGHGPSKTIASTVQNAIRSNIVFDHVELVDAVLMDYLAKNPRVSDAMNRELPRLDIGIDNMTLLQAPDGVQWQAWFQHHGHKGQLPWALQSRGTRSFLKLFPFLVEALEVGGIALIDELDVALHPHILPELLSWFWDPHRNPYDAQIFATLHSAPLLDHLDKEQVLFTEKGGDGVANIYALADIRGIRRSENFSKKYLGGVYGAVPHLG